MDREAVATEIREFVSAELLKRKPARLDNDTRLVTGGLLDSFSLVELVAFVEERFGVCLPTEECTVQTMDTVDSVALLVERYAE